MNIRKSLRIALAQRGLTQAQFAPMINVSVAQLSKYMTGKSDMPLSKLQAAADQLDYKVSELVRIGESK